MRFPNCLFTLFLILCGITPNKINPFTQAFECNSANFITINGYCATNYKLPGIPIYTMETLSLHDCTIRCANDKLCQGMNVARSEPGGMYTCDFQEFGTKTCDDLDPEEGTTFFRKAYTSNNCTVFGTSTYASTTCSPPKWTKVFETNKNKDSLVGTTQELIEIINRGAKIRIGTGSTSQFFVTPAHQYIDVSSKYVNFYLEPEHIGNHFEQYAHKSLNGQKNTLNVTSGSVKSQYELFMVFAQEPCGGKIVYDTDSVGNAEHLQDLVNSNRYGGTFVVRIEKEGEKRFYQTSSTVYSPELDVFGVTTKLDTTLDLQKNELFNRGVPLGWENMLIKSDGKISAKKKMLLSDTIEDYELDLTATWYSGTDYKKKIYSVSGSGYIDPRYVSSAGLITFRFDMLNLMKELVASNTTSQVFIKVEGGEMYPPRQTVTFQPHLITCDMNVFVCKALSGGHLEISGGILNNKTELEISSVQSLDYVYEIHGSQWDYYEVQQNTTKKTTAFFQKVTWYKSLSTFTLLYHYDAELKMITVTGSLTDAINSGTELIMAVNDHSTKELQIWPVFKTSLMPGVNMFQLHTYTIFRPDKQHTPDPRWKLIYQGMPVRQFLLLYTWSVDWKPGTPGNLLSPDNFSVKVYANDGV